MATGPGMGSGCPRVGNDLQSGYLVGMPAIYTTPETPRAKARAFRVVHRKSALWKKSGADRIVVGNDPVNKVDPSGLKVWKCGAPADIPVLGLFEDHVWLKTDKQETGMTEIPNQNNDGMFTNETEMRDHSDRKSTYCVEVPNVNEKCVDQYIQPGIPTGPWMPGNTCQNVVQRVLDWCAEK
jgi:hypothetical protein